MNHEESKLQQQCVAWFRAQYPQYAMLLTHPINEGSKGTRTQGAIHKAEGTVAGVPDLLFFMPSYMKFKDTEGNIVWHEIHGLGIEFKTKEGRQSPEQKQFQKMFEAAGYAYVIIRSYDDFRMLMLNYINTSYWGVKKFIEIAYLAMTKAAEEKEKERFYKTIGKKK